MKTKLLWLCALAIAVSTAWTVSSQKGADRDWPAYSGDKGATKYSSLDQINKDTVGKLAIAWRQSAIPAELKATYPDAQGPGYW